MRNKVTIFIALLVAVFILVGCSNNESITGKAIQDVNEKVSLRLPIPIVEAGQTPFYVAEDKGYYDTEGLDVTFNMGSPELNPVKMVASGTDQFGVLGGPDTLLVARSKGQPLVAIAIIHKNSDFPVILTLKDSGLTKVEDLKDKKVGFFYGHISTDVLRNLFRKENVDVEEVDVGFNYNPLISKQVDAEWAFRVTAGLDLPEKGIEVNTISPADYGINTHGYAIFTTEEIIKNNPELVENFLRATIKGIIYSVKEPQESVESLATRSDKIDKDIEYKRLLMYNEVTSISQQFPPGYMDEEMFQETYDRLKEEGALDKEFNVNEAFTTQFLDEIYS